MKKIIITGATSGLGYYIAKEMKKEKNLVINLSRKSRKDLISYNCELSDDKELKLVFKRIKKKFKKIDGLVLCAGKGSKSEKDLKSKWIDSINNNLLPAVFTIEIFKKVFGLNDLNIIIISSIAGNKIILDAPIEYSVSKKALNFYCKIISKKYGSKNTKINIISPGNILLNKNNWYKRLLLEKDKTIRYINKNVPSSSFNEPKEICEVIKLLLNKKSNFLGSNIILDGGQSL